MGIDYAAKLVFGIQLEMEDFKKMVRKYMPEDYEDDEIEFFQTDELDISQYYKGIYLGLAYPYNDADCENWIYYIGIGEECDEVTISEMIKFLSYKETDFEKLLTDNGMEIREPTLMAIPHVY